MTRVLLLVALLAPGPAGAGTVSLRVEIQGVSGAERENVETRLSIYAARRTDLDAFTVRRLHRRAEREIREALQPFGYYQPEIDAELIEDGDRFRARYHISLGDPVRVSNVDIRLLGDGAEDPALLAVLERPRIREGDRLFHTRYEALKVRLEQAAYAAGYADARYTLHRLRVNPGAGTAVVRLTLDTGPRYRFGDVRLEQDTLDDAFVRRYIDINPGEVFDPAKLTQAQFTLTDLTYFSMVEVEPLRDEAEDGSIPVLIRLTPRPPRKYSAGIGYGTDTGARVSAGAEFRRLNRRGHRLNTDARVSEIKTVLGADYRIPLGARPGETLGFSATYTEELFGGEESRKHTLGTSLSRTPGRWQRRLYLEFENETSRREGERISSDLLMPGVSLNRVQADNPIHARRGWALFLDTHGADQNFLSSTTFVQGRAQARAVLPLARRGRFLGRLELGGTLVDQFSELPPSQRFFAGGDQSVRGYAFQSLGPVDSEGNVVGGRFLTAFSVEAEHPVYQNWGAAVFFDGGGASNEPGPKIFKGVGAGMRYRAPVGSIQVDLAHPLDGRGLRLHLGVRIGV